MIVLEVDDEALVQRIAARATCGTCGAVYNDLTRPIPEDGKCSECGASDFQRRADDTEEALRTRLLEYYKKTSPLIGYYHAKGLLARVDGMGEVDAVQAGIARALDD